MFRGDLLVRISNKGQIQIGYQLREMSAEICAQQVVVG